jgi:DNA-binding CsgD family transcriptional regulator
VPKARSDLTSAIASAANLYGLTSAEAKVLTALIESGGGVAAIASALGLSRSTVKTHLEKLFRKTGMRRQAGLVMLVAGFNDPLPIKNQK